MGKRSEFWQKNWIYPLLIGVVGSCYYLCYFRYGISLTDEGLPVYGAERVLHGQLPMSDFLSYPPGSYLLLALLFKAFGVNLLVSRLMEMAFLLMNGLMLFYVGKRLMPKRWALLPAFIFIVLPGPWHKVFFTFGLLLFLVALFRFLEKRTTWRMLVVGGAAGIALIFKLEPAFYALLTTIIVLLWAHAWSGGTFRIDRKAIFLCFKDIFLYGVGFVAVVLPVLAYYFFRSSLTKLLVSLTESNIANVGKISEYFGKPSFIDAITKFRIGSLTHLFFFLILLLYLYFVAKLIVEIFIKKDRIPYLFPVVVLGLLSFTYAYSVFEKAHLLQSASMAYVLFGYMLYKLFEKKEIKWKAAAVVLVLLLGLYLADGFKWRAHFYTGSISRLFAIRQEGIRVLSTPKGTIYLGKKESDMVHSFMEYFAGKEGYLVPLYQEPMINFLTCLDNPTSFSYLFPPLIQERSRQARVINQLEKYRVKYLLVRRPVWTGQEGFGMNDYAPIVYEFVRKHYHLEKEIGDYLIFSIGSL